MNEESRMRWHGRHDPAGMAASIETSLSFAECFEGASFSSFVLASVRVGS
jgi:hypothetical protein